MVFGSPPELWVVSDGVSASFLVSIPGIMRAGYHYNSKHTIIIIITAFPKLSPSPQNQRGGWRGRNSKKHMKLVVW